MTRQVSPFNICGLTVSTDFQHQKQGKSNTHILFLHSFVIAVATSRLHYLSTRKAMNNSHVLYRRQEAPGQLRLPWSKQRLQDKKIYSYIQNIFKTGFLFWENTQSVHAKVVETATKSLFSFATPMEIERTYQAESYITQDTDKPFLSCLISAS